MLYFGTGYGRLWGYDTKNDRFQKIELDGCPVVTSPLVLRKDNRDLVIVGDKDTSSGKCSPGPGGKAWVVWGLDDPNGTPGKADFPLGGWVTASPVPGGSDDSFVIGSDGVTCNDHGETGLGKVLKLKVVGNGQGYELTTADWRKTACVDNGQAGGLAATSDAVFWVDVRGQLWVRNLTTGKFLDGWDRKEDLPALIHPDGIGFTNTEPAIDTDKQAIYVTLRNFTVTSESGRPSLRGCGKDYPTECSDTGAPGAIIALRMADASVKWSARLPASSDPTVHPSINTAPLILQAQGAVLFGDVNGTLHSYQLNSPCEDLDFRTHFPRECQSKQGFRAPFGVDDTCSSVFTRSLLAKGENPARGTETWSQVSGVGTDPMVVAGQNHDTPLLVMGVNYEPPGLQENDPRWPYGRLVAFKARQPYNLKWISKDVSPAGPWHAGQEVTFTGQVTLDLTELTLDQLVDRQVFIRFFAIDQSSWRSWDERGRPIGKAIPVQVALPEKLQPKQPIEIKATFNVTDDFPKQGYVIGVIDLETLAKFRGPADLNAKALQEDFNFAPLCPGSKATEVAFTNYGPSETVAALDNWAEISYQKQDLANVSIQVKAPAGAPWSVGGSYQAEFRITNHSQQTLDVPVSTTVKSGKGPDRTVGAWTQTLDPGETVVKTRNITLLACADVVTVTGRVNAEPRAFAETTYDDNTSTVATIIGDCDGAPPLGAFDAGPGYTIIVPEKCEPTDDITSNKPCKNYPLTIQR
jgi:hypothetical protein